MRRCRASGLAMAGQRHNTWTLVNLEKLECAREDSMLSVLTLARSGGSVVDIDVGRLDSVLPGTPDTCHWNVFAARFGLPAREHSRHKLR